MPTPKRKKHKYEVMLTSFGVHRVFVDGYSPEDALKMLHRKIAGKPIANMVVTSDRYQDTWSDPSEKGEEWLVAPIEVSSRNPQELMIWDGKSIRKCNSKDPLSNLIRASTKRSQD